MALIGKTNEEKIWNFYIAEIGNPYGVSGLMGNLGKESSLIPNNLQNNGNSKLNMTDEEFTAAVDSGAYAKDTFINDGYGYGLAQWTFYTLKRDLYEYWKSYGGSIGDLEMQCKFLLKELKEDFKTVYDTLVNATSVLEASNAVLLKFERPADQSESVQKKRAELGQIYYEKYATKETASTTPIETETERLYENGDIVDFTGTKHYSSSNATSPSECKPGVAKVTSWAKNGKHKYHLVRVSGGGSTVYGWVDEADIKGLHEENTQTGGTTMGYTNSSLVSYTKISPNKTSPRNHAIDTITIHCVVGQCSVETLGNIFAPTSKQASSNYGIGYDGKVGMYVEEKDRSWCSSNAANDHRAITIEVASDTTHPYAVNDKALASLINLVADICKRNGIKKLVWSTNKNERVNHLNGCNMTVHRDYANKSCPGDYLYNKHSYIASEVNKLIGAETQETQPTQPITPTQPTTELKFKEGDIVNFAGGNHYGSASATKGTAVKASKAKVTSTYPKGTHPYHLRAVNDTGSFIDGVYGWVDASTVSAIQTNTPTTSETQPTELGAGTKLTLKNVNLYASSGTAKSAGVRSGTYYVWSKDVINNRIRITNSTANVGKAGQVTGWISYTDAKNATEGASTPPSTNTFTSYKVQVTASELNIRKGAGTNYGISGVIKDKGIYTIVDEASGQGASKWGKLKSGAGWISLDYCKKI